MWVILNRSILPSYSDYLTVETLYYDSMICHFWEIRFPPWRPYNLQLRFIQCAADYGGRENVRSRNIGYELTIVAMLQAHDNSFVQTSIQKFATII